MRFILKLTAFVVAAMLIQTTIDLSLILTTYKTNAIGSNCTESFCMPDVEARIRDASPLTHLMACNVLGVELRHPLITPPSADFDTDDLAAADSPLILIKAAASNDDPPSETEGVATARPQCHRTPRTLFPIQPKVSPFNTPCR